MTSSAVDCFKANLLNLEVALARILDAITPVRARQQLPLKSALGRILAQDIQAPLILPPFPNSAVDGYAVNLAGVTAPSPLLPVVGQSLAGLPYSDPLLPSQAIRIFTGAKVPDGTTAVVMQEEVTRQGTLIRLNRLPSEGEHVRPAGSDVRCGEVVLKTGRLLRAEDLGLLAALGISQVTAFQAPRVAYFSTGDELRSLGESLAPGQIYDSNRYSLSGLLAEFPVIAYDLGAVPDDLEQLTELLREAGQSFDLILSSGGASVGEKDFLRQALSRVGEVTLWRIALKPGKPLIFGRTGRAWYFGLPGNPVSVHVAFAQIVRPAIWKLAGASGFKPLRLKARCLNALYKTVGRLEFQRGQLALDEAGLPVVTGLAAQESHQLATLSRANCFIILPADSQGASAGTYVTVEPFAAGFYGS
ncbi:MAG: molybdopterin molybdotransferase MoeA [Methylohalobius sp.]|nr:molybdopterin molybdotransferase MoeA [Methylohalobius sp.]